MVWTLPAARNWCKSFRTVDSVQCLKWYVICILALPGFFLEIKSRTEIVGDLRAAKLVMEDEMIMQGKAEIAPTKSVSSAAVPNPTYIPKPPDAYKATEIGKPANR